MPSIGWNRDGMIHAEGLPRQRPPRIERRRNLRRNGAPHPLTAVSANWVQASGNIICSEDIMIET